MNIVLIGSGNTATVLAKMIKSAGHSIVQVWSRNPQHAEVLAKQVGATTISSLQEINSTADICIIAVADQAIGEIASELKVSKKLLLHTAGSVSRNILKDASPNYGVLYPLQSLRKEMTSLPTIPFLVDGNSEDVNLLLKDFALSFSDHVHFANDETRLQMHLAAVFVSNFTNHLYALTQNYCTHHQLNFQLLHPLITEVADRLKDGNAIEMQTGPARRGDAETIQKHLHLLEDDLPLKELYEMLSDSISNLYLKK